MGAKGTAKSPFEIPDQSPSKESPSVAATSPTDATSEPKLPPPPQGPACFFPNDWHYRFNAGTFQDSASRSRSRNPSQKRAGASRRSSLSNGRRLGQTRRADPQPTVDEDGDKPPAATSWSRASGRGSRRRNLVYEKRAEKRRKVEKPIVFVKQFESPRKMKGRTNDSGKTLESLVLMDIWNLFLPFHDDRSHSSQRYFPYLQ